MTDQEIYEIASNVIASIAHNLSEGIYARLGGTLTASWSTEPKFLAWAESRGEVSGPPQHQVVLCYELALRLYRDAEDYHQFAGHEFLEDRFQVVFLDHNPKPRLPDHITSVDSVRNMFIGALTWVFFHELGHLMQEHGYIRTNFSGAQPTARIEDCESDGKRPLEGRAAIISHVTEIAADVEATHWCVVELVRHFLTEKKTDNEHSLLEFRANLYLLVCGISCMFYRFYGQRIVDPESVPQGSHPTPIRRLEVCLPNIFEKLDDEGRGERFHGLSRSQLVHLCSGAAYSAGFFWIWRYARQPGVPDNFMLKGLLQDSFKKTYWSAIVDAWDEMEPTITRIRRFGSGAGILTFTATFRSQILDPGFTAEQLEE